MHLFIVHYHLNRGGVTQVILNHLHALARVEFGQSIDSVTLLFGGRRQEWPDPVLEFPPPFDLRLVEVQELEYDEAPAYDPAALTNAIQRELASVGASPGDTLFHIHNHSLGKNASLVGAIENLSSQGYRFLLQVHDFAEDFRPANYRHLAQSLEQEKLAERLYPQSPAIHYAVLNGRDRHVLRNAGVADERLHLLPNPVAEFSEMPPKGTAKSLVSEALGIDPHQPLLIYPVRGIRRKNLGEMLLLSAINEQPSTLAVTLAPLNPAELESFQAWQSFAEELRLNCKFDIGSNAGLDFHTILAAADRILTTSVAEGFGMVFLEAWLAGRELVGRNLPEITADFASYGISYDALYDRLRVPLSLVDEQEFRHDLIELYGATCRSFGQAPASDSELALHLDELSSDGTVDFAHLSVRLQRQVIAAVAEGSASTQLRDVNPELASALRVDAEHSHEIIEQNASFVRQNFSLEAAGAKLVEAYKSLSQNVCRERRPWRSRSTGTLGTPRRAFPTGIGIGSKSTYQSPTDGQTAPLPHAEKILESFLDIRRLHPVRLT